jgi:hypothetical protein
VVAFEQASMAKGVFSKTLSSSIMLRQMQYTCARNIVTKEVPSKTAARPVQQGHPSTSGSASLWKSSNPTAADAISISTVSRVQLRQPARADGFRMCGIPVRAGRRLPIGPALRGVAAMHPKSAHPTRGRRP